MFTQPVTPISRQIFTRSGCSRGLRPRVIDNLNIPWRMGFSFRLVGMRVLCRGFLGLRCFAALSMTGAGSDDT